GGETPGHSGQPHRGSSGLQPWTLPALLHERQTKPLWQVERPRPATPPNRSTTAEKTSSTQTPASLAERSPDAVRHVSGVALRSRSSWGAQTSADLQVSRSKASVSIPPPTTDLGTHRPSPDLHAA